jgi:hypothetical protein
VSASEISTPDHLCKKKNISVNEAVLTEYTEDLFNLPLSQEAFEEFNDL